jgi:hypothetical protein
LLLRSAYKPSWLASTASNASTVKTNLKAAQPELDQLMSNQVKLEGNLFPNP